MKKQRLWAVVNKGRLVYVDGGYFLIGRAKAYVAGWLCDDGDAVAQIEVRLVPVKPKRKPAKRERGWCRIHCKPCPVTCKPAKRGRSKK